MAGQEGYCQGNIGRFFQWNGEVMVKENSVQNFEVDKWWNWWFRHLLTPSQYNKKD